ncbi:RNA recognition motif domain-containing protein [Patescibacteria group bacterium]
MSAKLYVGGIPFSSTQESLKEAFSQAGTVVSATIMTDKFSGRSRGFGFVEMSSEEEAQKAIELFHGKEFEGRELTVNTARPLEERPPRPQGGGGYGGGGGGGRGGYRGGGGGGYDDRGGRNW